MSKRSDQPAKINRRDSIKLMGAGMSVLGLTYLSACTVDVYKVKPKPKRNNPRDYPIVKIANLSEVKVNEPISFSYPLREQTNILIDIGKEVEEGVGPQKSIVAYNKLCQHMGCTISYDKERQIFVCPCHQSKYDPSYYGTVVIGQGKAALPRIELEVKHNQLFAVGVKGLIYGYRNNLMDGSILLGEEKT